MLSFFLAFCCTVNLLVFFFRATIIMVNKDVYKFRMGEARNFKFGVRIDLGKSHLKGVVSVLGRIFKL